MGLLLVFLGLLALLFTALLIYVVGLYNQLVQIRVNIDRSWANIEVLEKQRCDELPNLVKVCEAYLLHERETLERVIAARTGFLQAKTPPQMAKADNVLAEALKSLFAVAESYPELKANENFGHLQNRITSLENQIADRREFYNESVTIHNTRIQQVPYVFVANALGYDRKEMYRIPAAAEKNAPELRFRTAEAKQA